MTMAIFFSKTLLIVGQFSVPFRINSYSKTTKEKTSYQRRLQFPSELAMGPGERGPTRAGIILNPGLARVGGMNYQACQLAARSTPDLKPTAFNRRKPGNSAECVLAIMRESASQWRGRTSACMGD